MPSIDDCLSPPPFDAETEALYAVMSREALEELRAAFALDANKENPISAAFCRARIELIDRMLATRAPQ